jgi:MinD-like ATPase involved in chromosome partitioning or flagellar assembly
MRFMLVSSWSHKGSAGKSTLAAQLVKPLGAKILDLDGPIQYDLSKWAGRSGIHCEKLLPATARERLIDAANDEGQVWWADCHPGEQVETNLHGVAYADIVLIVVRGGGSTDLEQLGRCAGTLNRIKATMNPHLQIAAVFNAARETARDRHGERAVRSWASVHGATFLGATKLREAYPEAWDAGKSVLEMSTDAHARREITKILEALVALLPPELAPKLPKVAA